jgi:hypothetical protein
LWFVQTGLLNMTKQESNQILSENYNTLRFFSFEDCVEKIDIKHVPNEEKPRVKVDFNSNYVWLGFKKYAIRTTHKPGIQLPDYCTPNDLYKTLDLIIKYIELGVPSNHIQVWECAPHNLLTIHAEIAKTDKGFSCTYSFEKCPMREAFKIRSFHVEGTNVPPCFAYMDATGKEQLFDIFDRFPNHIVELSCFQTELGSSLSNTIFWEIRPY